MFTPGNDSDALLSSMFTISCLPLVMISCLPLVMILVHSEFHAHDAMFNDCGASLSPMRI